MKLTLLTIGKKLFTLITTGKQILSFVNSEVVVLSSMGFSLVNTAFKHFFHKYVISDLEFVAWLMVFVIIDTTTGVWKAYKQDKPLTSQGFAGLISKMIIYGLFLIAIHGLTSFTVNGHHPAVFDWADDVLYSGLIIREAWSIIENIEGIKPDLLPSWIRNKFKKLNDEGL